MGRNWCRRSLRGLRWGVNPRSPHAPCMARMSRVHGQGRLWAQHPGLQVGSPTRGAQPNLVSQHASRCNEFGHLKGGRQCTRSASQHLWDPREVRTPGRGAPLYIRFFRPLRAGHGGKGGGEMPPLPSMFFFSRSPQGKCGGRATNSLCVHWILIFF